MLFEFMGKTVEALFVDVMDFKENDKRKVAETGIVDIRNIIENDLFFFE